MPVIGFDLKTSVRMDFSAVMNLVLGGGLVATIIAIITLKSTVREARAKAEKATAEAETVRIDNTEHATRILIENIVEPLKEELMKTGKLCRRPGVKWHASGKPLILPTVAGIMMIVLFFTGCASTRKSRTEVNRNSSLSSSADNVSNVRRGC